ncbi:helix-turn-helix domain-containing protein [Actinoplanes sp. NBC_00393]|uniref:helix-turn-helix domain-containing protein n=1 Tax=Actinoplanes sp. NBC_00393 TaxID=2975953 RepID=UPI002E1BEB47
MAIDYELAVERRRLRGALRKWRRIAGHSQQQAASAMGWSLSKLVRLENGSGKPIPADVLALLTHYGAPADDAREFYEVARRLPSRILQNEETLRSVFNPAYVSYLEAERGSSQVRQWHPSMVPGILQTEEYAYQLLTKAFKRSHEDAKRIIDARLERQNLLDLETGPRFHFILDEGILLRPVGSAQTMRKQIEKIVALVDDGPGNNKRVLVQVLPLSAGLTPGIRGPFILLEFDDDDSQDVLFMETPKGDFFSKDEKEEVEPYQIIFGELEELSMSIESMRERIDRLIEQLHD